MNKKEYLDKVVNLIINKVKYHSPNICDDNIDFTLLDAVGIDATYPIFVFKKPLDKTFYQAFLIAKKKVDFNLILLKKPLINENKINKLDKTYVLLDDEIGSILHNTIDALNINYITHSNFEKNLEGEYIKVNNKKIELDFYPYYYYKKIMNNGVIYEISQYLLNGKNYSINFINTQKSTKKAVFEINIPLPRGYYFFKKGIDNVMIENLTTKEKMYFNYHFKKAKITFSSMNGIDSCTYACINFKGEVELLPQQKSHCYFNFGENKYCLYTPVEERLFFDISQRKMNEIFDIKLTTHDKQFDEKFNLYLPRNIWEKWQNFDIDEESENEWLKLRNNIIKKTDKGEQINQDFKGIKEVKFFRDLGWKRVFIVHNNSCYLFADKVKYFNFTLLTKEIFKQNNEIYLSFAD